MRSLPPALLTFALAFGCGNQAAPLRDASSERAAIDRTRAAYVTAWRNADAAAVAAQYAEDGVVLYPNQPAVTGRAAIHQYFDSFFKEFHQDSFALVSREIELAGDWAFDRGEYTWVATPTAGGTGLTDNGKYLVILRRQPDGTWRVARDMDNSDRPQAQSTRGGAG